MEYKWSFFLVKLHAMTECGPASLLIPVTPLAYIEKGG